MAGRAIRRAACMMLCVLLCLMAACALGEGLVFGGVRADKETTYIDFGSNRVKDIDALMAFLDQLPALKQVDLYASKISPEDMERLYTRYPDVFFGMMVTIGDHTVRSDITAFSTLHSTNPDPPHTSADFENLKYCKNLLAIDIGHNWVTDLSFLEYFPGLKVLIIAVNRIEDISVLAQLEELEYLELFSNKVRDYSPLANLHKLRDLNVKNNPCKDLTPLHGLTNLERFFGGIYVKIPAEQKKALKKALPDCHINWDSMPTGGNWRKHDRYFVIRDMFRTNTYIPFED